jgi:hypothetical protein
MRGLRRNIPIWLDLTLQKPAAPREIARKENELLRGEEKAFPLDIGAGSV